jgi:hypothetical protein
MQNLIVSKQRVADHGEVRTASQHVKAMLDLVEQETSRIDSRFLEPACGNGNFLAEVLTRKLFVVESKYAKCQLEYERNAILAASSMYGIDILEDNILECRERLFIIFDVQYTRLFNNKTKDKCRDALKHIFSHNIILGDALTLKTSGNKIKPLTFSEWSFVKGSMLKRRDFTFHNLLEHERYKELPLFSDLGKDVFIPTPSKEFPPVHFMELSDEENKRS